MTASGPTASARTQFITIGQDNVGWDVQYAATSSPDPLAPGSNGGVGATDGAVTSTPTAPLQWQSPNPGPTVPFSRRFPTALRPSSATNYWGFSPQWATSSTPPNDTIVKASLPRGPKHANRHPSHRAKAPRVKIA